jgi:hypothetical protein
MRTTSFTAAMPITSSSSAATVTFIQNSHT